MSLTIFKYFIPLVLFLGITSHLFSQSQSSSFRDFKGLESTFYDDDSGHRYLHIRYKEALTEKPKVGFLRLGLSFLKIHNLRIELDTRWASQGVILELFEKVISKRGVRYAIAEPIELIIHRKDGDALQIKASKGKFTSDGSLKVWGNAFFSIGESEYFIDHLSLTPSVASDLLVITLEDGKNTFSIPLKP